jgi:4-aminobutyrate aminotransferase-like enzyme
VAVFNKKIGDRLSEDHFPHGYTYASHPTCCAAGLAGIQVLLEEKLVENAANVGEHLLRRLKELEESHRCVGEARGVGLFTAIELVKDKTTKEPLLEPQSRENVASYVRRRAKERGLLVGTTSFAPSVVRLSPPLCITINEIDWAIDTLDDILLEVDQKMY